MMITLALMMVAMPILDGDFDHDGKPDRASIILRNDRYVLLVDRGADPGHEVTVATLGKDADYYLVKAPAARRIKTACGKGYGPDQDRCVHKTVDLHGGELMFGVRESSDAVALWTGKRFDVVWLTD